MIWINFLALYLLVAVPIFNIDKHPFALLCAYNAQDHAKRFVSYVPLHSLN